MKGNGGRMISTDVLVPRLAELGKIKIGGRGEKRTGSGGTEFYIPKKFSHFVVTGRERGANGEGDFLRDNDVHGSVGEAPTELNCHLPFDEPSQVFQSQLQQYEGRTLRRWCDGVNCTEVGPDTVTPCALQTEEGCACKPYGRLQVILDDAPYVGGVYVFRTTSWESVRNIQTVLLELRSRFGFLTGLPLMLKVYPATDEYQDGNKRKTSKSWKVALVMRGTYQQALELAQTAEALRLGAGTEMKAIAASTRQGLDEIDATEEGPHGDEYHPSADAQASVATQGTLDAMKAEEGVGTETVDQAYSRAVAEQTAEKTDAAYGVSGGGTAAEFSEAATTIAKLGATVSPVAEQEAEDGATAADLSPAELVAMRVELLDEIEQLLKDEAADGMGLQQAADECLEGGRPVASLDLADLQKLKEMVEQRLQLGLFAGAE